MIVESSESVTGVVSGRLIWIGADVDSHTY